MADFNIQALHDEIEVDPEGLGYKEAGGEWKEDQVIVDLINAKNYKVDMATVEQANIRATTTFEAYDSLSIDEQEWLRWMTPADGPFPVTADMKMLLSGRELTVDGAAGVGDDSSSFWLLAHQPTMAPAMLALIEVDGSRAEVLWGQGHVVTIAQVAYASNL